MEIFKKTSTVAYLMIALMVIVVIGFWFSKPASTETAKKDEKDETKPAA